MAGLGLEACPSIAPLIAPPLRVVNEIRAGLTKVYNNNSELFTSLANYYKLDFEAQLANNEIWDNLAYRE